MVPGSAAENLKSKLSKICHYLVDNVVSLRLSNLREMVKQKTGLPIEFRVESLALMKRPVLTARRRRLLLVPWIRPEYPRLESSGRSSPRTNRTGHLLDHRTRSTGHSECWSWSSRSPARGIRKPPPDGCRYSPRRGSRPRACCPKPRRTSR